MRIKSVNMEFLYDRSFLVQSPEAYERLILDCIFGDHTLFNRADSVAHSWEIVDAIRQGWAEVGAPICLYDAGSWGPPEADRLMYGGEAEDRRWREP
jgi:glucose-6-phosphate 1-dehydrogenase